MKLAVRSVVPVSRVSCGVSVTVTTSEKTTWMDAVDPMPIVPFAVDDVTLEIVAANVS